MWTDILNWSMEMLITLSAGIVLLFYFIVKIIINVLAKNTVNNLLKKVKTRFFVLERIRTKKYLNNARRKYRWFAKDLNISGPLKIDEMYIPLKLESADSREIFNSHSLNDTNSCTEMIEKYRRMLVLGEPGAGKTTFFHKLMFTAVDNRLLKRDDCFPIMVQLPNYLSSDGDIYRMLLDEIENLGLKTTKEYIYNLKSHGRLFILFDSLDEVREEYFDDLCFKLSNFCASKGDKVRNNRYFISCRNQLFSDEIKLNGFKRCRLKEFSIIDIEKYIHAWPYYAQGKKPEKLMNELTDNRPVMTLCQTPLMLAILVMIYNSDSFISLPNSVSGFLDGAIANLYERRKTVFKTDLGLFTRSLKIGVLRKFALKLVLEQQMKQGFELSYFLSFIRKNDENLGVISEKAESLVQDYIKYFGIITVINEEKQILSFIHKLFQEHLVAKELLSMKRVGIKNVYNQYIKDRNTWSQILFFYSTGIDSFGDLNWVLRQLLGSENRSDRLLAAKIGKVMIGVSIENSIQLANAFSKQYLESINEDK